MADSTGTVSPCTFPSNKFEALAMLYMQQQNLSDMSPEQILDRYQEVYGKMRDHERMKGQVTY